MYALDTYIELFKEMGQFKQMLWHFQNSKYRDT